MRYTKEHIPTVVLADDEPHIRMMMRVVLARAGFQILAEASNGREAVERCRETRPDIALLDINMPVLNGDEALRKIVSDNPDIVVIMLTSVSDSLTVSRCIEQGAANYLRKDTPVQEIASRVLQTWKDNRAESDGAR